MNKKSIKLIISVLTCLELCFTFLAYKSFSNKDNIEKIKEVSIVNRKQFAMYRENSNSGKYEVLDDIYFPSSDYILNKTKSSCEDNDGNYIDLSAIDFKDGKLKISSAKTLFCNLYFDVKGEAYALYTADDSALTFVRSKTPYSTGDLYNDKTVSSVYTGFEATVYDSAGAPWYNDRDNITTILFEDEIEPISTAYWFYDMSLNNIDINNLNISKDTNMSNMFNGAIINGNLNLSAWDMSKVTNVESMFSNATLENIDMSNWNFASVTSLSSMFHTAIINSNVNVSNWNLGNVTDMNSMFAYSQINSELNLGSWDTTNVTNMSSLFAYATINANIGIENWNTGNVTTMAYMFDYVVNNVDINLADWNVSSVKTFASFMRNRTGSGKFTKPSAW